MFANFDFDVISRSWVYLFQTGMVFTLNLTFWAMLGGIIFGTILAMMRLSANPLLHWPATAYVNTIRSIPLILVIFWFYFLVPFLLGWITGSTDPVPIGAFQSSLITFVLFEAAYYCEIMRAGIQSGAARAGMGGTSAWHGLFSIDAPRGVATGVSQYAAGVNDAKPLCCFRTCRWCMCCRLPILSARHPRWHSAMGGWWKCICFVAVVYFVLCLALSQLVKRLQKKVAIIR